MIKTESTFFSFYSSSPWFFLFILRIRTIFIRMYGKSYIFMLTGSIPSLPSFNLPKSSYHILRASPEFIASELMDMIDTMDKLITDNTAVLSPEKFPNKTDNIRDLIFNCRRYTNMIVDTSHEMRCHMANNGFSFQSGEDVRELCMHIQEDIIPKHNRIIQEIQAMHNKNITCDLSYREDGILIK